MAKLPSKTPQPEPRVVTVESVQLEDRPPIFLDDNVARLIDEKTEQLSADIYKVLTELKLTRRYTFDNPSRVYRIVGWYLRE